MSNIAQINDTKVSIINFKSIPVVTSEMLADFYQSDTDNIKQNFSRNAERFIEGKHYFKLEGLELKAFKHMVTDSHYVPKRAARLMLWTERGAARHAKMLDTDQAWEVFEQLEDCYFHRKEVLAKTHKSEREPLTNAVNMLIAKSKHLNYSDAYKLVHQRFNVEHIEDIPYDAIPVAVEYVHHLIAMFSNADKMQLAEPWRDQDVQFLMWYVPKIAKLIKNEFYPALTLLRSEYAAQMIGMAQEMACHANILNQAAIKNGMTTYTCLGGQAVHTMKWYLEK